MTQVRIGGPGAMMLVSCGGRLPNGFAELLAVTIRDNGLEAGRDVYEGYSNGFESLAAFFEELAESEKVLLWQSTDPDGWKVKTTSRLEAGEQLSRAAQGIAALVRG
jgi:hypothetical protein